MVTLKKENDKHIMITKLKYKFYSLTNSTNVPWHGGGGGFGGGGERHQSHVFIELEFPQSREILEREHEVQAQCSGGRRHDILS